MKPDTDRVSGDGRGLASLQEIVTPMRERLEETARNFAEALTKAGESVKKIQPGDVADLMRRSPLTPLMVAAGIGLIAGLLLRPRER